MSLFLFCLHQFCQLYALLWKWQSQSTLASWSLLYCMEARECEGISVGVGGVLPTLGNLDCWPSSSGEISRDHLGIAPTHLEGRGQKNSCAVTQQKAMWEQSNNSASPYRNKPSSLRIRFKFSAVSGQNPSSQ